MFRRLIRKAAKRAQKWLAENGDTSRKPAVLASHGVDYDWLNRVLYPSIAAEGGTEFRPNYTWGVLHGAHLAKVLGIDRISVIEFGVAGGNGLVSLEKIAQKVGSILRVGIDVYGFDTGVGLPKPQDHRDLPNLYSERRHPMEVEKLRERIESAELILGLVENTIVDFIQSAPSPVAFVSVDLDLYSSTVHALRLLDAEQDLLLPRVHCYFDDMMGFTCCEYNGERLAIAEFNNSHETRKIAPIYGLKYFLPRRYCGQWWTEQFYLAHIFDHDLYGHWDGLARVHDLSLDDI